MGNETILENDSENESEHIQTYEAEMNRYSRRETYLLNRSIITENVTELIDLCD